MGCVVCRLNLRLTNAWRRRQNMAISLATMKWIALCVGVLSVALVDAQIFQNFFQHAGNPFFERSDEEVHSGSEPTWYQARVQHGTSCPPPSVTYTQHTATNSCAATRLRV